MKTARWGMGSAPRIHPRPAYPSLWNVVEWEIHHLVRVGVLGVALVHLFLPLYLRARTVAKEQFQMEDRIFFVLAMTTVHSGCFFLLNIPYAIMDTFQIGQSYKLHRKPYMVPTRQQLLHLLLDQTFGHLVYAPVMLYWTEPLFRYGLDRFDAPLPSVTTIFWTFPFMSEINDILFYFGHRLLHTNKYLYRTIHKRHHEFFGTVAYAAEYSHPLEGIVANQWPLYAGPLLLRPLHPLLFLVWIAMTLQHIYEGHSGYCFLLPHDSDNDNDNNSKNNKVGPVRRVLEYLYLTRAVETIHHDFHHTHNQGNFGGPIWMDWIMGTMDAYQNIGGYRGYLALKRHGAKVVHDE